jgi:hypothetical protein
VWRQSRNFPLHPSGIATGEMVHFHEKFISINFLKLQEIRPTLNQLGLSTPEELGYDKPELVILSKFYPYFFQAWIKQLIILLQALKSVYDL